MTQRSVCLFCSAVEDLPEAARELAADFGTACAAQGKAAEARYYLGWVLSRNPRHPAALANLARLDRQQADRMMRP